MPVVGDDDALVRVAACGLCGTDDEQYMGELAGGFAFVPGHETIEAIGPRAAQRWGVPAGDRVAVEVFQSCRQCENCLAGEYRRRKRHGLTDMYGFISVDRVPGLWGSYAESQYLAPDSMVLPVPEGLDPGSGDLVQPTRRRNALEGNGSRNPSGRRGRRARARCPGVLRGRCVEESDRHDGGRGRRGNRQGANGFRAGDRAGTSRRYRRCRRHPGLGQRRSGLFTRHGRLQGVACYRCSWCGCHRLLLPQRLFDAAPGRFGLWWVVDRFELWCYQLRCTSS